MALIGGGLGILLGEHLVGWCARCLQDQAAGPGADGGGQVWHKPWAVRRQLADHGEHHGQRRGAGGPRSGRLCLELPVGLRAVRHLRHDSEPPLLC